MQQTDPTKKPAASKAPKKTVAAKPNPKLTAPGYTNIAKYTPVYNSSYSEAAPFEEPVAPKPAVPKAGTRLPDGTIQLETAGGYNPPVKSMEDNTVFKTNASVDDSVSKMGRISSTPNQKVFNSDNLIPYASNIINSFRKPPMPVAPQTAGYVTPGRISLDDSRVDIARGVRGQIANANRTLDNNTAAAVGLAATAQGYTANNTVNVNEANANAQLKQQADTTNAGIEMQNNALINQYHGNQVEAQVAQQRAQSANVANAADKYISSQDQAARMKLDKDKFNVLSGMYKDSGVLDRYMAELKKRGVTGLPEVLRMGGKLKKVYC